MRNLILIIAFLSCVFRSHSSHIVGGDIYYDYLGNGQYKIYISVFRDCLSQGADFDSPLPLGIFIASNNTLFQQLNVPYTGKTQVPVTFNNPCVVPPTNICTENTIYTTIVNLPPRPGGYKISYVRCCRGPNINNISNPEDTGLTLTVNIPGNENSNHINSSPRFNAYPPMLLCNNDDLVFNHAASDPDGDEIRYSLATPYSGGTTYDPMPTPTPQPPYSPIFWGGNYSEAVPLGPGSSINIDPITGLLTASPNLTGRYVVGIRVSEYRNGVLISTMIRDFIFRVFNCNITLDAILPLQEQLPTYVGFCTGNLTVNFVNNSYGGTHYQWDFGDPATSSDVSTAFSPSYTYSDTGTYYARLVVNPGWPCTDTAIMEIKLYNPLESDFTHSDSICLLNNQFEFNATTSGPVGTNFSWNFGPNAQQPTATGAHATASFTSEGVHQVILTTSYQVCETKDTANVYVIPQPEASFSMPSNYQCEGLEVQFINNTQNASNHFWDFGVNGSTSTEVSPTFEFPAGGTYVVKYYASSSPECIDSTDLTIQVNDKLEMSFTQSEDQCISSNSFDFIGTVSGPAHATYGFTLGNSASAAYVNGTEALGIQYNTPGTHQVIFTGQFDQCIETITSSVIVFKEPTIGFALANNLQCAPYPAHFINYSTSDTEMSFEWNFGDGATSNERNPTHVYTSAGNYPVTLSVWTTEGCIDTLTLTYVDLINILSKPTASFDVDKVEVDICNSEMVFTNQSEGATHFYYHYDDGAAFSHQSNNVYRYRTSGDKYVYLIATSEQGCKDTAFMKLYVEPFSVFIPNTFTPNADTYNDYFGASMYLIPFEWDLKIYNRWGEIVFETQDYLQKWDGRYNGELVQFGNYTYKVRYRPCSIEYNTIELTGNVNVIR